MQLPQHVCLGATNHQHPAIITHDRQLHELCAAMAGSASQPSRYAVSRGSLYLWLARPATRHHPAAHLPEPASKITHGVPVLDGSRAAATLNDTQSGQHDGRHARCD
jgi:hypothetical protein